MGSDILTSYSFGEAKTATGQTVEFECSTEDGSRERIQSFFTEHIRNINIPVTGSINISHGCYGRYTRFDIEQHDYAGGGSGYIESLEIKNPPDERNGFIMHEYSAYRGSRSYFTEWESLEALRAAWEKTWGSNNRHNISELDGFIRRVECDYLSPWFYAVANQELFGDYALPQHFQDDPVFSLGKRFIVYNEDGDPSIKTCMGARIFTDEPGRYSRDDQKIHRRLVFWSDGSVSDLLGRQRCPAPRPAQQDELWVAEAIAQFQEMLTGDRTKFTIDFLDGHRFTGRITEPKSSKSCSEGDYHVRVTLKEKKTRTGWVNGFVPTLECPNIVQYVTKKLEENNNTVESVKILESKTKPGGKKWKGIFFRRDLDKS